MKAFDKAFEKTIGHEGGFGADPLDNGNWTGGKRGEGELKGTKYGISAGAYPNENIKELTIDRAKEIYKNDYWSKNNCDGFIEEIGIELFDTGVNMGTHKAATILQKALNYTNRNQRDFPNIPVDGNIGKLTMASYQANKYKRTLFNVMNILQGAFYLKLMDSNENYEKYIGWFNRIEINKS